MPMEWHQRQSSGELVGKVNNGVGKVVQTAEGSEPRAGPGAHPDRLQPDAAAVVQRRDDACPRSSRSAFFSG